MNSNVRCRGLLSVQVVRSKVLARKELIASVRQMDHVAATDTGNNGLSDAVNAAREVLTNIGFLAPADISLQTSLGSSASSADDNTCLEASSSTEANNEEHPAYAMGANTEEHASFSLLDEMRSRRENFWIKLNEEGFLDV